MDRWGRTEGEKRRFCLEPFLEVPPLLVAAELSRSTTSSFHPPRADFRHWYIRRGALVPSATPSHNSRRSLVSCERKSLLDVFFRLTNPGLLTSRDPHVMLHLLTFALLLRQPHLFIMLYALLRLFYDYLVLFPMLTLCIKQKADVPSRQRITSGTDLVEVRFTLERAGIYSKVVPQCSSTYNTNVV